MILRYEITKPAIASVYHFGPPRRRERVRRARPGHRPVLSCPLCSPPHTPRTSHRWLLTRGRECRSEDHATSVRGNDGSKSSGGLTARHARSPNISKLEFNAAAIAGLPSMKCPGRVQDRLSRHHRRRIVVGVRAEVDGHTVFLTLSRVTTAGASPQRYRVRASEKITPAAICAQPCCPASPRFSGGNGRLGFFQYRPLPLARTSWYLVTMAGAGEGDTKP